jgi:PAS domain-containing protein
MLDGGASPLPWLVDLVVSLQLLLLLYRNIVDPRLVVAVPTALALGTYAFLFVVRPQGFENYRVLLLSAVCLSIAVSLPVLNGQPIASATFVACLGLMVLFFARGTKSVVIVATLYTVFVTWRVLIEDSTNQTPGHGWSVVFALISTVVVALLIQGHFMLRSENALSALKATAAEARAADDDLQESATVGGIGLYRIDLDSGLCEVNAVFRELLELPESDYPAVTLDHFASRFSAEGGPVLKQRVQGDQFDDLTLLTLHMRDGRTKEVKAMSRRVDFNGRRVRSGIIMAVAPKV